MTDTEVDLTEEALAAGLLGIDASRRVGWAKAFEALRRNESLEEEVRQMRDEMKYLRRAYSRLLGFVNHTGVQHKSSVWDGELAAHLAAEETFRYQGAWSQGVRLAELHLAEINGWDDETKEKREAEFRARKSYRGRMLSEIRAAARNLGHVTKVRRRLSGDGMATAIACSCGERCVDSEEKVVYEWRYDHLARVALRCSFAEYKKQFSTLNRVRPCHVCGDEVKHLRQGEMQDGQWVHYDCLDQAP